MGKSQSRVTLRKVNCVSGAWCAPWDESLGVRLHSRNNVDSTGKNGRSCILQSGKDSRPVLAFPFVGLLMADGKTTPWSSLDAFLSRSFGGSHELAKNVIDRLKIDNFGISTQIDLAQTVPDVTEPR